MATILSESRKYASTLTIGHQYLEQLPEPRRAAVFGNVGSIVSLRAGASDAPLLAEPLGLGNPDAILDLPNFTARARLIRNGRPTSPIYLELNDAPRPRNDNVAKLIELSRQRFVRDRGAIERRINRFLST